MADDLAHPIEKVQNVVRHAVRSAWPELTDEDIARVDLDVDSLAAVLRERVGHDAETAESEARAVIVGAVHPATGGNAGWVEILDGDDERRLGRGQMLLFDATPDSEGTDLAGTISSIRREDGVPPLSTGVYLARFEANGETRRLAAVIAQNDLAADTVAIALLDDGLPISIRELSAGE